MPLKKGTKSCISGGLGCFLGGLYTNSLQKRFTFAIKHLYRFILCS